MHRIARPSTPSSRTTRKAAPSSTLARVGLLISLALTSGFASACAGLEDQRPPPPPRCSAGEPALSSVTNPERRVEARYPRAALRAGINGFVCLNFTVEASGAVSKICIADAMPDDLFDRSAGEALSQWQFEPPRQAFRSGTCMMFDVR